ncbi:MAG TPA: hypothetical protein VIK06_08295 [Candidatus Limnocylindrales bacterium]
MIRAPPTTRCEEAPEDPISFLALALVAACGGGASPAHSGASASTTPATGSAGSGAAGSPGVSDTTAQGGGPATPMPPAIAKAFFDSFRLAY